MSSPMINFIGTTSNIHSCCCSKYFHDPRSGELKLLSADFYPSCDQNPRADDTALDGASVSPRQWGNFGPKSTGANGKAQLSATLAKTSRLTQPVAQMGE